MGRTNRPADSSADRDPGAVPSSAFPPLAGAGLDDLLRELLNRVDDVVQDQRRLRLLLDAVVGIAADLSLDGVLARIVQVASELVEARYAALGVLGTRSEQPLRAFIHHGMSDTQRDLIGDLPRGHGLLGQIIDQPRPLRLHDLAEHPSSYGFPAHHPAMRSFLGVPIRIGERVFGNLYLTEKAGGGDFTEQDEAIVVALAAAAGVVIENARLYEEASRREDWLTATAEVTADLSAGREDSLHAIADRAREAASADLATILLRSGEDDLEMVVVSGRTFAVPGDLPRVPVGGSLAGAVIRSGEPIVVEDARLDARTADDSIPPEWPEIGPCVVIPLRTLEGVEGALTLAWTPDRLTSFRSVDVRMAERFVSEAALALQLSRAREDREKLAVLEDRDRIARDLHDLVIQRLFAIGLALENTARRVEQEDVRGRVASAVDDIDATIKDIRRSIFALSVTPGSTDLRATVTDLVDRAAMLLGFRPALRFDGPVDSYVTPELAAHVLAVLAEALSNTARHAEARHTWVQLSAGPGVVLTVRDDGRGVGPDVVRSGLRNMQERAVGLGGTCTVESPDGGGTTITWSVPGP